MKTRRAIIFQDNRGVMPLGTKKNVQCGALLTFVIYTKDTHNKSRKIIQLVLTKYCEKIK